MKNSFVEILVSLLVFFVLMTTAVFLLSRCTA